jgi:hypothetical protein
MHNNFMCKNNILNSLDNILHNACSLINSAKILREAFDWKYKAKDANVKKFWVDNILVDVFTHGGVVMS